MYTKPFVINKAGKLVRQRKVIIMVKGRAVGATTMTEALIKYYGPKN